MAREEFIINSYIKIHPRALIEFKSLKDRKLKEKINDITFMYKDKKMFFDAVKSDEEVPSEATKSGSGDAT